jgi:hypothetical protein
MATLRLLRWNTEVREFTHLCTKVAPPRRIVPVAVRVLARKGVFLFLGCAVSECNGDFLPLKKKRFVDITYCEIDLHGMTP